MSACVVLPAHNEAEAVAAAVDACRETGCSVVVSASACQDDTARIAREHGAEVIDAPRGKGRAIQTAFNYIQTKTPAPDVVMLDCDNTYPASYIETMLDMLDDFHVVLGIRDLSIQPWIDRWGNNFITRQAQLLYGKPIYDLCSGMWAFRGSVLSFFQVQSYGFTLEAELFTQTVKHGFRLGQVTIPYYPRVGEKKINRLDHLRIMAYLWSHRL